MTAVFVGAFNPISDSMPYTSSGAGAKVQCEIVNSITLVEGSITTFIMQEFRTWPFNKFYISGFRYEKLNFLPMVNISFLKNLCFAVQVFFFLLNKKNSRVYLYNTNGILNLLMFILGLLNPKQKKILIIQDFNVPKTFAYRLIFRPDKLFSFIFSKLIKYSFDFFVPITKQLGEHLNLPVAKSYPFLGAVLSSYKPTEVQISKNIAVFAGALEPYNGVDYLVDAWIKLNTSIELHIFGSGSLFNDIKYLASKNKNVIFHGFQNPCVVKRFTDQAKINFCLRYSRGIQQEFYFPSKFFDVVSSPGVVVCNRFSNIPSEFNDTILFVEDNFSDLSFLIESLDLNISSYERRLRILSDRFSWLYLIRSVRQVLGDSV